jgi:hypothetical protein
MLSSTQEGGPGVRVPVTQSVRSSRASIRARRVDPFVVPVVWSESVMIRV